MNNKKFDSFIEFLDKNKIEYKLIKHKPILSVEEGLQELGIDASEGFSTLIMKADGKFIAVVRRDDNKMSLGKIKKALKIHNLEFATRQEVLEITQCDFGYISPYNPEIVTYIDEKLLEKDFIYGGTGSSEYDLKINPKELAVITKGEVLDISKE